MRFFERSWATDTYTVVCNGFALLILVGAISPDAYAEEPPAAASLNSQHEEVAQEPKAENDDQAIQPTDSPVSKTFKGQITVTATKREATTQEIPISIEVLTGERLSKMVVENPFEAAELVPNLTAGFGVVSNAIAIRGVGSGAERSFEQAVTLWIDDVYMPRSRQWGQAFLDVTRIEVMRGPQAVIHGLNSTAGAVSVVTNRTQPGDPFFTDISAAYEFEYGGPMVTAIIGGSPSESLGLRAAVKALDANGYFTNSTLGHREGDTENLDVRLGAVWQPSDTVSLFAKLEYSDSKMTGHLGEIFALQAEQVEPEDGVLNWQRSSEGSGINPFGVFGQDEPAMVFGGTNASVNVEVEVGTGSIAIIGAWTDFHHDRTTDVDTSWRPIYDWEVLEDFEKTALELRWASAADLKLAAIAGVYYHRTDLVNHSQAVFGPAAAGPGQSVASTNLYGLDSDLMSGFAQLTWRIDPSVRLIGGLRYAREHKEVVRDSTCWLGILPDTLVPMPPDGPVGLCPDPRLIGFTDDRTSDNTMPELAVEWDVSGHSLLYAKVTTSAKAGGYASAISFNPNFSPEYGDEKAVGYEVGLRSSFTSGIFSATAFLTDFDDLQVNSFVSSDDDDPGSITQIISNAAGARSQGLELQGRWVPHRSSSIGASLAWLDATYTSFTNGPCNSQSDDPTGICDLTGEKLPYAPDWSVSLFADFRFELGSKLDLVAGLNIAASDGYLTDGTLEPAAAQGSWVRTSARVGIESRNDRWSLSLIGRNLSKEAVHSSSQSFGSYYLGYLEPPRTVTLMGTYRIR
ncbi:MAG: TonB-dependent receptor [Acidobacteria bacterium]|nr:TonB-dependent receptor [Candidatus Sulfomarinibacter kjeldsenii]